MGARTSSRRSLGTLATVAALALLVPSAAVHGATDADLRATLQLPEGEIDFELETDVLQSFDAEGAPFLIQVIDGCAINGYYWVFAAGLGPESVPLTIFDERSGKSHRTTLPAYVPGEPFRTVFDPEALAICRQGPSGGIPENRGRRPLHRGDPGLRGRQRVDPAALRRSRRSHHHGAA